MSSNTTTEVTMGQTGSKTAGWTTRQSGAEEDMAQEEGTALPWWKADEAEAGGKVKGKPKRTMDYDAEHGQLFIDERDAQGTIRHTWYYVEPLASDWGRGFRFFKVTGTRPDQDYPTYDVNLDTADLDHGQHSCECLGHLHRGSNRRCRHVAAVVSLIKRGIL